MEKGESVAVVKERAISRNFPDRIQGRTGEIIGKRGSFLIVKINDQSKSKEYLIHPIHLKKIKTSLKKQEKQKK